MVKLPWGKKPWEKVLCTFELQEYGVDGGKGWNSITEPTGKLISREEAQEYFKPDRHYRVIARALEGAEAGRFIGIVWQHYEPARGLVKKEEKKEKIAPVKPKEPEEYLEEYAEKVERMLEPIPKIFDVMDRIRGKFTPSGGGEQASEGTSYEIPAPEFEGKLPAIMHPYVVHVIAEEIKGVIDYGATRIQQVFGAGGLPEQAPPKEEEEELIPSITKFKEKKKAVEVEKAEEEAPAIPMPKEEAPPPIEEKKEEEVVPSLVEEKPEEVKEEEEEPLMEKVEREELEREFEPEEEEEELPSLPKKPRRRKKDE